MYQKTGYCKASIHSIWIVTKWAKQKVINMKTELSENIIYGDLTKLKKEPKKWGTKSLLFENFGHIKSSGVLLEIQNPLERSDWLDLDKESVCIVEKGSGSIFFNGKPYEIKDGFVFKIFPNQQFSINPKNKLQIFSVNIKGIKEHDEIIVVDVSKIKEMVYEYETLGQELITCDYSPGIGIIKFAFPIDKIPLHRHPLSDRIIRTISGKGYTYASPKLNEMNPNTFCVFPKGIVHTNGPTPGNIYRIYAFQLPWVDSMIDEENIAGDENFVQYIGPPIPKELWKTKEDFYRVIKKLENKN